METPEALANQTGRNPGVARTGAASTSPATKEPIHQDTTSLMDHELLLMRVLEKKNLVKAYKRVVNNRGSAGVDDMNVRELAGYIRGNWKEIERRLLAGTYQPQPVLRVEIPKPDGKGKRKLGIPIVLDRMIQQAVLQVLNPIFDTGFSDSSYGFREGRSAHQAGRCRRFCQISCWTIWTKSWNGAGCHSAAMPTTATCTWEAKRQRSE